MKKILIMLSIFALIFIGVFSASAVEDNNITDYASLPSTLQDGSVQWSYTNLPSPTVLNSFRLCYAENYALAWESADSSGDFVQTTMGASPAYNYLVFNAYDTKTSGTASRWNFGSIGAGQEVQIEILYTYVSQRYSSSTSSWETQTATSNLYFAQSNTFTYTDIFPNVFYYPSLSSSLVATDSVSTIWYCSTTSSTYTNTLTFTFTMPDVSDYPSQKLFPVIVIPYPNFCSSFKVDSISLECTSTTDVSTGQFIVLNQIESALSDPYTTTTRNEYIVEISTEAFTSMEQLKAAYPDFFSTPSLQAPTSSVLTFGTSALNTVILSGSSIKTLYTIIFGGTVDGVTYTGFSFLATVISISSFFVVLCFFLGFNWSVVTSMFRSGSEVSSREYTTTSDIVSFDKKSGHKVTRTRIDYGNFSYRKRR